MTPNEAFKEQLESALTETGLQLQRSAAEVAAYTAQRALHLSTIVGQPGYAEAVKAERDAVALYAGITAVNNADAADNRIIGIIQSGIALLAIAAAPPG